MRSGGALVGLSIATSWVAVCACLAGVSAQELLGERPPETTVDAFPTPMPDEAAPLSGLPVPLAPGADLPDSTTKAPACVEAAATLCASVNPGEPGSLPHGGVQAGTDGEAPVVDEVGLRLDASGAGTGDGESSAQVVAWVGDANKADVGAATDEQQGVQPSIAIVNDRLGFNMRPPPKPPGPLGEIIFRNPLPTGPTGGGGGGSPTGSGTPIGPTEAAPPRSGAQSPAGSHKERAAAVGPPAPPSTDLPPGEQPLPRHSSHWLQPAGPARDLLPVALVVLPAIGLLSGLGLLLRALAPFFSRLHRSDMLDHPRRGQVLDAIRARPWSTLADLARLTGVPRSTLRHHLRMLRAHGLVTVQADGQIRRFHDRTAGPAAPFQHPVQGILREELRGGARRLSAIMRRLVQEKAYSRYGAWKAVNSAARKGLVLFERRGGGVWVQPLRLDPGPR